MLRNIIGAAVALAMTLYAPVAVAQKPNDPYYSSGSLDLQVCNRSGYDAFVAVISRNYNGWLASGWFRINNGYCDVVATTDNLIFYLFAEQVGDSDYYWGGNFEQCVMRPGPYEVWVDPNSDYCPSGMSTEYFRELEADTWGTFTWNLTP